MNVGSYLKRTNKTNLTNEEILILDVLFDSNDTFESLVKENYASWHNLPYSHDQETDALRGLIDKLMGNGLVKSHSEPGNRLFYGLTETGGKLWEAERAPNWERYCTDSTTLEDNGNWKLVVESPSIVTAKAFMDCAKHCLLYGFNRDEIRSSTLIDGNTSTIHWRLFPTVCSMTVTTYPLPETTQADPHEYETKRIWWRDLMELAKFQLV